MAEQRDFSKVAPLTVTLIANQGIAVQFMGITLLADAIHDDLSTDFSPVPADTLREMTDGNGKFSNAQYLLFTHAHPDHFSAARTADYLSGNRVSAVFYPHQQPLPPASSAARRMPLSLALNVKQTHRLTEHIAVTFFRTKHMGEEYSEVPHYCALLRLGEHNLLLTGDAACDLSYFQTMLAGVTVHIAFVNPLYLSCEDGRKTITQVFQTQHLVVYHLPFVEHDRLGLRRLVDRNLSRFGATLPPVTVLQQMHQTFQQSVPL